MKEMLTAIFAALVQPLIDAIDRNTAVVSGKQCGTTTDSPSKPADEEPEAAAPKKRGPKPAPKPEPEPAPEEKSANDDLGLDEEPEEEAPAVTLQDVKTAAQTALAAGNKPAVLKLLAKFEVEKITEIPPAKYAAFHAELLKLKKPV